MIVGMFKILVGVSGKPPPLGLASVHLPYAGHQPALLQDIRCELAPVMRPHPSSLAPQGCGCYNSPIHTSV